MAAGDAAAARAAAEAALEVEPGLPAARRLAAEAALATAPDEAVAHAARLPPGPERWRIEAAAFLALDRPLLAIEARQALAGAEPDSPAHPLALAELWLTLGEPERARPALRRAAGLGAATRALEARLAATTSDLTPAFVRELFDGYAARFDHDLLEVLGYDSPQRLAAWLDRTYGPPPARQGRGRGGRHGLAIVDLGCGTGLGGVALAPYARRLHGVDIAPLMLAEAAKRDLYQDLALGDFEQILSERRQAYDLAVALDMFCYVRDPAPGLAAIADALAPGGRLFATFERGAAGIALQDSRRYAHGRDLIQGALSAAGFSQRTLSEAPIRRDRGRPVPGLIVAACKP